MSEDADLENEILVRAYHIVFGSPDAKIVLEDLASFCRAAESCWDADPRRHAVLEGRREVWLRIQRNSKLLPEQILDLLARRRFVPRASSGDDDNA